MTERPRNTFGDPDSPLFGHEPLRRELEVYRRLLLAAIPWVWGSRRRQIVEAAEELAWARARELPDWRLEDVIPQRRRARATGEGVAGK